MLLMCVVVVVGDGGVVVVNCFCCFLNLVPVLLLGYLCFFWFC